MFKTFMEDTCRASYTIYQSLLTQGRHVFVLGGHSDEPLEKICPSFIHLGYSEVSALDGLIERVSFNFFVPGCTFVSYKACAEVSHDRFQVIDSVEATRAINGKSDFRDVATHLEISAPKVQILTRYCPVISPTTLIVYFAD